jgi:hypothetical protein
MDHSRIKKIVEFIASLLIEADAPALLREKFGYLSSEELKVVTEWLRAMAEQNFAEADAFRREDGVPPYRRNRYQRLRADDQAVTPVGGTQQGN